jgi:hypothetical protein
MFDGHRDDRGAVGAQRLRKRCLYLAADVPNAAPDFLKPQFHGKMVTPYPADDDVTLWVFHHIVRKYG